MALQSLVIDPKALREAAGAAVAALKILANEDRLLLLCQISQGEFAARLRLVSLEEERKQRH